ncbi:MAG TPA: hypothetical protein VIH01_16055 [Blastococcus sp.]
MFTITRRRLVDDWRRRGRCPRGADDDRDLAGHLGGDVEDVALAHLGRGSVRGIRGLLPDDQRAVVLLRLLGDLAVEQGSRQRRQGERSQPTVRSR